MLVTILITSNTFPAIEPPGVLSGTEAQHQVCPTLPVLKAQNYHHIHVTHIISCCPILTSTLQEFLEAFQRPLPIVVNYLQGKTSG